MRRSRETLSGGKSRGGSPWAASAARAAGPPASAAYEPAASADARKLLRSVVESLFMRLGVYRKRARLRREFFARDCAARSKNELTGMDRMLRIEILNPYPEHPVHPCQFFVPRYPSSAAVSIMPRRLT